MMSEREFTHEQKEDAGEKSHDLATAEYAAQEDSNYASLWRGMMGDDESSVGAEAAEQARQNAHQVSENFYAEHKDILHEAAYDELVDHVDWESGRKYYDEMSIDAKWAHSNPSVEAMKRSRQETRSAHDEFYRQNTDPLHEAALREDVVRGHEAEKFEGEWADINQILHDHNINLYEQSDNHHIEDISQLLSAGVNPDEIVPRLVPDDLVYNLDILHRSGAHIQPDELLSLFGEDVNFEYFFAKKLLKLGANPREVLAHLKYPGSSVVELVKAGIDPQILFATMEPNEIAESLWEFVHAGIDVNVNELISRMDPASIAKAKHKLLWAGVDPSLIAEQPKS